MASPKNNRLISGKWWKIENKIKTKIIAKYDKIKDWKRPKGYFLIHTDLKEKYTLVIAQIVI